MRPASSFCLTGAIGPRIRLNTRRDPNGDMRRTMGRQPDGTQPIEEKQEEM